MKKNHELKKGKEARRETHLNSVPCELAWDCSNVETFFNLLIALAISLEDLACLERK